MQFVKASGVVTWSQGTMRLVVNQTIDDDHPLVKERPDLFTEDDPGAEIRSAPVSRVQTTMQKPGEQRTEKGPRRSA